MGFAEIMIKIYDADDESMSRGQMLSKMLRNFASMQNHIIL